MSSRILIVDDEASFAQMLHELLTGAGFSADYMTQPQEALERARGEEFGLIILDYKMPKMDGAEFLKQLRQTHPQLPVVMVSGLMNTPDLVRVANIGVDLVLEKPLRREDFVEVVRRFISSGTAEDPAVADPGGGWEAALGATGPVSTRYLPTLSTGAAQFASRLHAASEQSRHLFLTGLDEYELWCAARDVACWRNAGDRRPWRLAARSLSRQTVTQLAAQAPGQVAPVLVVSGLEELDREARGAFWSWLRNDLEAQATQATSEDDPESRMIFMHAVTGTESLKGIEAHPSTQGLPVLAYPALNGRIEDIAGLMQACLEQWNREENRRVSLAPEAVRLILNAEWSGGLRRVEEILRRAYFEEEGDRISPEALQRLFEDEGVEVSFDPAMLDLERVLTSAQRHFLTMQGPVSADQVLAWGVPPDRYRADEPATAQPLWLPELLGEGAN